MQIDPLQTGISGARQTEQPADHDGAPWHARLFDRRDDTYRSTHIAHALAFNADDRTWLVDEIDDRQMERVAEVDERFHLLGGGTIEATPVVI